MRLIDADALKETLTAEYDAYRSRGTNVTMYDLSYTLGDILEFVDAAPSVIGHYDKCRDCKWLSNETSSIGRKCVAPGKKWKKPYQGYKQPSAKACKKYFERREA